MSIFNETFTEFFGCLNRHDVDYILVGGYTVVLHGYPRMTGDLDIWVRCDEANYQQLILAFKDFNMPIFDMTLANFIDTDQFDVFKYGRPPLGIDIITKLKGLNYGDAKIEAIPMKILMEQKFVTSMLGI